LGEEGEEDEKEEEEEEEGEKRRMVLGGRGQHGRLLMQTLMAQ
jgi:hypothetical protein